MVRLPVPVSRLGSRPVSALAPGWGYWRGRVALKLLAQGQAQALAVDEAFRARFIRESRAAAVEDPHVIPVLGAGEGDGLLYIPVSGRLRRGGGRRA